MKTMKVDYSKKTLPVLAACAAFLLMLLQWIVGLNIMTVINVFVLLLLSAVITVGVFVKKRLYLGYFLAYVFLAFGIFSFYTVAGADAGWGAVTDGKAGFSSAAHALWTGEGSFWTRLAGNVLLILPSAAVLSGLYFAVCRLRKNGRAQFIAAACLSVVLTASTLVYFFTMNLRAKPKVFDMKKGHDEYLDGVAEAKEGAPNVLFILMDDLGYGDTSYNGGIFPTPNIDGIAEEGLSFDNFYASYSVCSPSRFAALTGRYPYRGYADNVLYPTVSTFSPYASTRVFNSIEMGANADGMLGDEITVAEVLKSAGYSTGAFGKWHLGDYGQYLPTNQGFDYFYGSHHVNDMTPFYFVEERGGEYEIAVGVDELRDQSRASELIHGEISDWIENRTSENAPFFAYYATPWPHAPVYAGEAFRGKTGMGVYADCVTEFDHYLGELFSEMDRLGVLDDTVVIFSSDNGPALQGSTADLRGGKYTAYEGGQKVPFYLRWTNNGGLFDEGGRVSAPATMIDLFPTLVELCGIESKDGERNYLPFDRETDGVSMTPAMRDGTAILHNADNPILYMKREKIKAVQYSVTKEDVLARAASYDAGETYPAYDFLQGDGYVSFKYFRSMQNDNPAFFDKRRKNWLHITTDDAGENYNRAEVFPDMAEEMNSAISEWTEKFKKNRRGINREYYK